MLKGDLISTPLAPLLLELANDAATGCLTITDSVGDEALVCLKSGLIYSVSIPGDRPQLGAKLVSSGALAPEALAEALDAQRTELQGWRLGELLVHLGYVEQAVVEDFVKEQVCEAMWDLIRWPHGEWKFRKNIKAREDVGPPVTAMELLETLRDRGYKWETISAVMHGPGAVPKLSARSTPNPETTLDSDAWSMLCKIDGERSVADLARDCGYTLFEAGHVIVSLVRAGLVDIEEEIEEDDATDEQPYGASMLSAALAGQFDEDDTAADAMAKLARLAAEVSGAGNGSTPAQRTGESGTVRVGLRSYSEDSFATSIARVSSALAEVLGDEPPPEIEPVPHVVHREAPPANDPEWEREKQHRLAAAAELATAQELIEALRTDGSTPSGYDGDVPKLRAQEPVQPAPAPVPAVARDNDESAHAAEEAARVAAEEFARAAAEEAERLAAEQEAQRLAAAAERTAAEEAAWAEYEARAAAERLRAERAAAEDVAWAEYQEREDAERLAAQEAARLAAVAEAAAAEAVRIRREQEAAEQARVEAERLAAEAAERRAAEAAERARVEAERLAAEQAERAAAEAAEQARAEAERVAAEEAERARVEAERLAAEEAARLEAERLAAEEAERARVEAERLAVEQAERAAAEAAEQARAEADRVAADEAARQEADQQASEAAARQSDEAAAAKALLVELAAATASTDPEPAAEPEPDESVETPTESDELADADDDERADVRQVWGRSDTTDTAALLRELSSLGGDEPTTPSGTAPQRPTRTSNEKKPKKKIGLFGL